jgi:hypothetical protein
VNVAPPLSSPAVGASHVPDRVNAIHYKAEIAPHGYLGPFSLNNPTLAAP